MERTVAFHLETDRGVTKQWVDALIDVLGEPAAIIVGRAMTVDQLVDVLVNDPDCHDFLPETREEELAGGHLGQYRGASLYRLVNYRGPDDEPLFPRDELWIVGTGDVPRVAVITDLGPE